MDYPGRLYFFLIDMISACGDKAKTIWLTAGIILFLFLLTLTLLYYYRIPTLKNKVSFFYSPYFFLFISSLFILLERFPFLLSGQLTPDEDLWMAGGATIMNDPRFWISFNPTTSGPLVVLPIILVKILGLQINYSSVRLTALLFCILPSVVLVFFSFKNLFNEKIARVIVLPLIVCISFLHLKNYIAYNSEHVPILLISLSIFIYSKIYVKGKFSPLYFFLLLGITLGCFSLAKLQAVPIAAGIAFIFTTNFKEFSNNRKEGIKRLGFFLLGCIVPLMVMLFFLSLYNGLYDFWISYIISNTNYAIKGLHGQISHLLKFRYFIYLLRTLPDLNFYFISLFFTSIIAFFVLFILKRKELWSYKRLLVLASAIILTSYYGIVKPSNFYEHYFLLFFIPMIFLYGTIIGIFQKVFDSYKSFHLFLAFLIITTVIVPSYYCFARASSLNLLSGNSVTLKKDNAAKMIAAYAATGEKMAIWGWETDLYIQTGLTLGTRYGDSYHQLTKSDLQSYYINNYILDLKRNKPKIFVDAITPSSYFFNELRDRHENYSIIDSYIKENYRKVGEVDKIRIYIRN
jgi:hypothetical protein